MVPPNAPLCPDPDDWLVAGLLPRVGLVLLSATPKAGATDLTLALARAVDAGRPLAGLPVRRGPARFVTYDPLLTIHPGPVPRDFAVVDDLPPLDEGGHPVELDRLCREARPALVVVDPLYNALARTDLDRPRRTRRIMARLAALAAARETCLLLVHQTGWRGRPCGHAELPRSADATILITRDRRDDAIVLDVALPAQGHWRRLRLACDGVGEYRSADLPAVRWLP